MRRSGWVLALLLLVTTIARGDYLLLQYTTVVKKDPEKEKNNPNPITQPTQIAPGVIEDKDTIRYIVQSAVEVRKSSTVQNPMTGQPKMLAYTQYGTTNLFFDDFVVSKLFSGNPYLTVKQRYNGKKRGVARASTPAKQYELAEFALNHGLIDEFAELMDDLAKNENKTGEDKLDRAVESYKQVKEGLDKSIDREDATRYWRNKLNFRLSQSKHYSLLYNTPVSDPPEVRQRLASLEENMRAVYFWFALKGQVLKMPEEKLVAVLISDASEFGLQQDLQDEPLVADSFFSARDNVVVFCSQRLDAPSRAFSRQMQAYYQEGWDRAGLLQGKSAAKLAGKSPAEQARMATLALLDKALEDESERASVTHDGTRQLFVGAGLQRTNVVMPDWVQFGMASVMETPKSPCYGPVEVRAPFWTGYCAPSWAYARAFRDLDRESVRANEDGNPFKVDQFDRKGQLMLDIVQDAEFARAHIPGRGAAERLLTARAHAWGLCYFLMKTRTSGVIRLYAELAKLPRDLEPEPKDIVGCFCRAFDVADTTGASMDPRKFQELADSWIGFMDTVQPPGTDIRIGIEAPTAGGSGSGAGGSTPGKSN
jgi:hypothetical protein